MVIHEIVFHGKGGYDYDTIYNMPIWLRKFTFQSIQEHYDKEKEEYDKVNRNTKSKAPKISKPNIKPAFKTKALKK